MNTATLIFNRSGWDGIFCREIIRYALQGKADLVSIGWQPGDEPLSFPSAGPVYVCGLPLDDPFGQDHQHPYDCPILFQRLVWLDNSQLALFRTDPAVPGLRYPGVAVSRLAYNWFVVKQSLWDAGAELFPPTEQDFLFKRVVEPPALRLVQSFYHDKVPSAESQDFLSGLDTLENIDWPVLLSPWGSEGEKYIEYVTRRGESLRQRAPYAAREKQLLAEIERKDTVIRSLRAKLESKE